MLPESVQRQTVGRPAGGTTSGAREPEGHSPFPVEAQWAALGRESAPGGGACGEAAELVVLQGLGPIAWGSQQIGTKSPPGTIRPAARTEPA